MGRVWAGLFGALACLVGALPDAAFARGRAWWGGDIELQERPGDAAAAAGAVRVTGPVKGDAILAAGEILLLGEVGGDVRGFAGRYEQTGPVFGEVSIAAGAILIDAEIGDDLWAAGEDVELRRETRIGQDARIAGEDVLVRGRIDGDLAVAAEQVALDGQVFGNVTIDAKRIVIGPNATIEGKLRWRSGEQPLILPEAIIGGGVEGELSDPPWFRWPAFDAEKLRLQLWLGRAALAASSCVLALIFSALAPGLWAGAVQAAQQRWLWAAPVGLGVLLAALAAVALGAVSTLGAPLSAAVLFSMPLAGLVGYGVAAVALGRLVLELSPRPAPGWVALAIGVLVLAALSAAPGLGWLAAPLAALFGVGALCLAQARRLAAAGT